MPLTTASLPLLSPEPGLLMPRWALQFMERELRAQLWRDHDLDHDHDCSQDRPCLGPQEHAPLPSRTGCSGLSVLPQVLLCALLHPVPPALTPALPSRHPPGGLLWATGLSFSQHSFYAVSLTEGPPQVPLNFPSWQCCP